MGWKRGIGGGGIEVAAVAGKGMKKKRGGMREIRAIVLVISKVCDVRGVIDFLPPSSQKRVSWPDT